MCALAVTSWVKSNTSSNSVVQEASLWTIWDSTLVKPCSFLCFPHLAMQLMAVGQRVLAFHRKCYVLPIRPVLICAKHSSCLTNKAEFLPLCQPEFFSFLAYCKQCNVLPAVLYVFNSNLKQRTTELCKALVRGDRYMWLQSSTALLQAHSCILPKLSVITEYA